MIRLMGECFKKALRENGCIIVTPFEGWPIQDYNEMFSEKPHKIIYAGNEFPDNQKLFNCLITITSRFISVKGLSVSKDSIFTGVSNKDRLKSLIYTWLDLSLDALELFGAARKKVKMRISSSLPGFANLLMEKNYRRIHQDDDRELKFSDLLGEVRDVSKYVGLKNL